MTLIDWLVCGIAIEVILLSWQWHKLLRQPSSHNWTVTGGENEM